MSKNKFSQEQIEKLQNSSLNQLGRMIQSGKMSIKQMRQAYTQMRDIAQKRVKTLNKERNVREYGKQNLYIENGEYFRKLKSITSESELLKEMVDLSTFLKSKLSTVTGLKEKKRKIIKQYTEKGIDMSGIDYVKFLEFLKWFKTSEYAKKIPSDVPIVKEVFDSSPNGTKEDWEKAFKEFLKYANTDTPRRHY